MTFDDPRALARAATLIENRTADGREIITRLFPNTGRARIIGITGPPGAGKSSVVDRLVALLRARQMRVAVIAVDPSSPFTRGALLGDRIRMQQHFLDPGVFVRSMASRGHIGGVAPATLEVALLLDAAGFDVVLIETLGAGQDEIEIAEIANVTVVVLAPGMGDDVQANKAGIMEIASVFAVNKADLSGAEAFAETLRAAALSAPVRLVSALGNSGFEDLWATIESCPERDPVQLWEIRLRRMLQERIAHSIPEPALHEHASRVAERSQHPYAAVDELLALL